MGLLASETSFSDSLVLQGVELTVKLHIIPLIGGQLVVLYGGEGVQKMGTQTWVNVIGHINGWRWSVLCPVCEVAWQYEGRAFDLKEIYYLQTKHMMQRKEKRKDMHTIFYIQFFLPSCACSSRARAVQIKSYTVIFEQEVMYREKVLKTAPWKWMKYTIHSNPGNSNYQETICCT